MTQELTVYQDPPARDEAKGLTQWFEQWLSPEARVFEINTQDEAEMAGEALKEIKAYGKKLEEAEKSATGPLNQSLQVIRSWFAPGKAFAKQAADLWGGKLLESNARRKREAAEAARQVEAALRAGDTKTAIVQHAQIQPVEKVVGIGSRKTWQAVVINPALVPAEYLVVDMVKVRAEMHAQLKMHPGEVPVVPGVKFEQVEGLSVSTR